MRSTLRFLLLVLLTGVGVALAVAVVTTSDPPHQKSPNEVVQTLIDAADGQSSVDAVESRDTARNSASVVHAAATQNSANHTQDGADRLQGRADQLQEIANQLQHSADRLKDSVQRSQDSTDPPTPMQEASETGNVRPLHVPPRSDTMPSINAGAVYITAPAMPGFPAGVPGRAAPYQVPYFPMAASQTPQAPAQTEDVAQTAGKTADSSGTSTAQDDSPAKPTDLRPPPDDEADGASESQIQRDEGDDSLIINLKDEDIRVVLETLSQHGNLNILPSKNVTGVVSATLSGVDVRSALKAILKSTGYVARHEDNLIYVGTPEDLKSMDQAEETIGMRVYRPNYVTATELQALVTPLLTESVGTSTVSSPSQADIPSDSVKTGGDDFANGEVLLVRDYESVLDQIDQIIEKVDQRPQQVAIEAVILTVKLGDSNQFGVNFEVLRDKRNMRLISGTPMDALAGIDVSDGGLKVGFLDSSLSLLLEALETVGDTNVVASPKVMCLNKQRAEVHIGQELGYITTTVTETAATQTVEFLEVGTQLRIRPFISSDGIVRMEIHPELSTGSLRDVQAMTVPDKNVTQVTSNILCRDGRTVVIGGLIRKQLDSSVTQIPLFGSLPLLGPAFRQKTEAVSRDEIIVLITPRIVHDPFMSAEGQETMHQMRDHLEVYADKMSPIGTRYYGRRYYRKAQAAWAASDADAALRYVNLAIHFDRQNTDALRLRREIVGVYPQADNDLRTRLRQGLPPWQRPHVDYSRSGWPWRTPEPALAGEEIIEIEEVHVPQPAAESEETIEIEGIHVPESAVSEEEAVSESHAQVATTPGPLVTFAAQPVMAPEPSHEEDE